MRGGTVSIYWLLERNQPKISITVCILALIILLLRVTRTALCSGLGQWSRSHQQYPLCSSFSLGMNSSFTNNK